MAFVGAIASVIGGVVGAIGAMQSANAQARAAEYNAAVQRRNAQAILAQTDNEAADTVRENRRRMAAIRSQYGASGLELAGSPLDVLTDTAIEQEYDVKKVRYAGQLEAIGKTDQAKLYTMEAKNARTAGTISAVGALFSGFSAAGKSLMQVA